MGNPVRYLQAYFIFKKVRHMQGWSNFTTRQRSHSDNVICGHQLFERKNIKVQLEIKEPVNVVY